jgi:diguanylate cyclase (GGDEF)-like protein/PAS domain S-box-containing protein
MKVIRCHACSGFFGEALIRWIVPAGAVAGEEASFGALRPFAEVREQPRSDAVPYCPTCLPTSNGTEDDSVSLPGDVYRALVEDLLVGVYLIQDDRLIYVNRRFGRIFGYSRDEVLRLRSALDVIADSDRARVAETLRQRFAGELDGIEYTVKGVRKDGQIIDLDVRSVRTMHAGRPAVMGGMIDITEQRRLEEDLRALSVSDPLTGLYNRRGFLTLARGHLALAQRHQRPVCLIFADLDNLKGINDQFGHAAGDRALIAAATILRNSYRAADVVARVGGDEFAIFPVEVSDDAAVPLLVARLEERIDEFNRQHLESFPLSLSIGVGRYHPENCRSVEELLAAADAGLYDAKRRRRRERS